MTRNSIAGHILAARAKYGSWSRLGAIALINPGTLKYIGEGKRRPSAAMRRRLVEAGLLPTPRPTRRIPWRMVALAMSGSSLTLPEALAAVGVDPDRIAAILTAG